MAACRSASRARSIRCGSANGSAPGNFAQLASAYRAKHGVSKDDLKRAIAHVSVKSHANGTKNPKAHLQKADHRRDVPQRADDRRAARPVRLLRRVGWRGLRHRDDARDRARAWARRTSSPSRRCSWRCRTGSRASTIPGTAAISTPRASPSKRAYEEAGIKNPREEVSMMEVHDCFSITELVTMEDLHISPRRRSAGRT